MLSVYICKSTQCKYVMSFLGESYSVPFQQHDEAITALRQDSERHAKELQAKYEKKMKVLREELELRRKTEIHEIEEVCSC